MIRSARASLGLGAAAVVVAACSGGASKSGAPPASTSSTAVSAPTSSTASDTASSTSTSTASGTSTTSAGQSGATNLAATPAVKATLLAALAAAHHLLSSDYTGLQPGSTYYAIDHATGDYWAGAAPMPSPASEPAQVSSQDDGSYAVFTQAPGGAWQEWDTGATRAPGGRCPVTVPADVLADWGWIAGSCTPPPTASTPTSSGVLPTVAFASWSGRDPATIFFSGDSGNIVTNLAWSWSATGAVGHGTWTYDSCIPSCAGGSTTPYPATISLSEPVGGQFTQGVEQTTGAHAFTYDFALPSKFINAS